MSNMDGSARHPQHESISDPHLCQTKAHQKVLDASGEYCFHYIDLPLMRNVARADLSEFLVDGILCCFRDSESYFRERKVAEHSALRMEGIDPQNPWSEGWKG